MSKKGFALDPTVFAPGSCLAFSPISHKFNHHTVFVDPGHGGRDPGAQGITTTGATIYEAKLTLPVAQDLSMILRKKGYRVVLSRTTDSTVIRLSATEVTGNLLSAKGVHNDIAGRDQCANLAKATLLLGIYFDAGASPKNAGSIAAYDAARPFATQSDDFATLLQNDVIAKMNAHGWNIPNDGVLSDVTLGGVALSATAQAYNHLLLLGPALPGWFTTPSNMPGSILEPLFITDPMEGSVADSQVGQTAIAQGMAQAIESYFSPSAATTASQATLSTTTASATTTTSHPRSKKSGNSSKG